jgi:hypothetical protein
MNPSTPQNTHQKALRVNLDASKHGTFAEIGAGQEVARWFFHVGGAAGTVAKSISAYDMAVSDSIYGHSDRYVSRERLEAILDQEFTLLVSQLGSRRPPETTFFVFADTMATRSFSHPGDGQGWMGLRYQHVPGAGPSEIILHVRMLDVENAREQEAIGVLGVNLVYGAFYASHEPESLITSLLDGLTRERIEIDLVRFSGPAFEHLDNRLMILQLVVQRFAGAVMFAANGDVIQPADALHRKPVLVERGSFRPVTNLTVDMIERARSSFKALRRSDESPPVVVLEMTLQNLLQGDRVDHVDFLARTDVLAGLGFEVLITSFGPYYKLAEFLRRHTREPLLIALGVPALRALFDPKYYRDLPGGILEGCGRLFSDDTTLFVYPSKETASGRLLTFQDVTIPPEVRHLFAYLVENRRMLSATNVDETHLHILPSEVLRRIQVSDRSWETMVPDAAIRIIKDRALFGYRPKAGKQG